MKQASTIFLFSLYTISVFAVGIVVGWGGGNFLDGYAAATPEGLSSTFRPFWETWNLLHKNYYEQPLDDVELVEGAIAGMLATLDDPHTRYLSPEEQRAAEEDSQGEFEGIGATVEEVEGVGVVVVAPIEGSPADLAGIKAGDILREANGIVLHDVRSALAEVRGPSGTMVDLLIERDGEQLTVSVARGRIEVASVRGEMLADYIAYIRINQFGAKSADEFELLLRELIAQSPNGVIIDVRNNPGGLLSSVLDIADDMLDDGIILQQAFGNGRDRIFRSDSGDIGEQIPLVVLINEGSASASEVLAGAIAARDRGQIVGVQSFGKGTVQRVETLSNGGGLRVTIAHWLTPDGASIHKGGITPDVVVEGGEEPDLQLDTAVKLLQSSVRR